MIGHAIKDDESDLVTDWNLVTNEFKKSIPVLERKGLERMQWCENHPGKGQYRFKLELDHDQYIMLFWFEKMEDAVEFQLIWL